MQYAWREGGPKPKVDANIFGAFVEALADEGDIRAIKPQTIVEAAKNDRRVSSLFEWDNAAAGELYRRVQARHYLDVLQIVRVQVEEGPAISDRAFFSVPKKGYVPHNRVMADHDLKVQVIAQAKRELESFIKKYTGVLAMGNLVPRLQDVIDAMRDEIDGLEADATKTRRSRPQQPQPEPHPVA